MHLTFVLLALVGGAAWLYLLPRLVLKLLARCGMVRPNYRGVFIPVGYGLVVVMWSVPALLALVLLAPRREFELAGWMLAVGAMGLLGFIDDRWGDRSVFGLRGHARALLSSGRVTTGLLKAVGGLVVSFVAAFMLAGGGAPGVVVTALVIALSANAINLLDTRPGRAGAAFLIVAVAALSVQLPSGSLPALLLVLVPAAVAYVPDARGRVMLGDTGANALGAALGMALTEVCTALPARFGLLAVLVGLHIVAERRSLSGLIEAIPFLRRLDSYTGKR